MSAEVIQFSSERDTSGFSATQANDALAVGFSLIHHGIADDAELDQTEEGAVYLCLEREDGFGWLAFKERGLYLLVINGLVINGRFAPPLVSSPDFNDLLEGQRALARNQRPTPCPRGGV